MYTLNTQKRETQKETNNSLNTWNVEEKVELVDCEELKCKLYL